MNGLYKFTVDILPTRTPNNIFNGRGKEHRDKAGGIMFFS